MASSSKDDQGDLDTLMAKVANAVCELGDLAGGRDAVRSMGVLAGHFLAKSPWPNAWAMLARTVALDSAWPQLLSDDRPASFVSGFRKDLADFSAAIEKGLATEGIADEAVVGIITGKAKAVFDKLSAKNTTLLKEAVVEAQGLVKEAAKSL